MAKNIGPVNSIVLSRSGEADNVYLQDETSIQENGLCEIKIIDNQIMNDNNRSDYLPDLLSKLGGLEYYINDFSSTGICYLELCDRYTIQIDNNSYNCVMLNDEIDITSGLEELIHTDLLEESQTDYTKADKTDRKINQTYLIVDKQNQVIQSVISNVSEQNNKISQITQTVDGLNSKIQDIADITTAGETNYASLEFEEINQSEPIEIKIKPITTNISYLYPSGLYPSDTLYMPDRKIRFTNTTTSEIWDYELPDDLLYYDSTHYDEFYLNYGSQTCQVIKRCAYDANGDVVLLSNEVTTDYTYPIIELTDGDYTVEIVGYEYGYLAVRLMASNIYTSQFATKAEVSSELNQTSQEITAQVDAKFTNYSTTTQMNSAISIKANEITSTVSSNYETKNSAQYNYSQLRQTDSSISSTVATKVGKNEVISKINQSSEAITINANKISLAGKTINLTSDNIAINSTNFNVSKNGNLTANNGNFTNANINGGAITLRTTGYLDQDFKVINTNTGVYLSLDPNQLNIYGSDPVAARINLTVQSANIGYSALTLYDSRGYTSVASLGITTPTVTQTSLEKDKKNFEKLNNALEIIKNIDIYKYNLKVEDDGTKKHIGFVIGDNFNYSKEITSTENNGVDIYSFISVCCKAINEQQEEIEQMKKEINKLKGEK